MLNASTIYHQPCRVPADENRLTLAFPKPIIEKKLTDYYSPQRSKKVARNEEDHSYDGTIAKSKIIDFFDDCMKRDLRMAIGVTSIIPLPALPLQKANQRKYKYLVVILRRQWALVSLRLSLCGTILYRNEGPLILSSNGLHLL